jgi:hypothetical protein
MAEQPALSAAVIAQWLGQDDTTKVCRRLSSSTHDISRQKGDKSALTLPSCGGTVVLAEALAGHILSAYVGLVRSRSPLL